MVEKHARLLLEVVPLGLFTKHLKIGHLMAQFLLHSMSFKQFNRKHCNISRFYDSNIRCSQETFSQLLEKEAVQNQNTKVYFHYLNINLNVHLHSESIYKNLTAAKPRIVSYFPPGA